MRISFNNIKTNLGTITTAGVILLTPLSVKSQTPKTDLPEDTFTKTMEVPPSGTSERTVLLGAPSPEIYIEGEKKTATIVVDLSKNILYKYNEDGDAEYAYLVASGKKTAPTDPGVRIVTHIETYPYKSAPLSTKRRKNPGDYGPKIICLETLDPETGRRGKTGEFIHGNKNPNSLGKYASLGCIRMDNDVIRQLSREVKRGDIVIIRKD